MDTKLLQLINAVNEVNLSLFLSMIVDDIFLTGILINEQNFFVETSKEYASQIEAREWSVLFEDPLLKMAHIQDPLPFLHLAQVTLYLPSGQVQVPTFRVDPQKISAWTFLFPGSSEKVLERIALVRLQRASSSQNSSQSRMS